MSMCGSKSIAGQGSNTSRRKFNPIFFKNIKVLAIFVYVSQKTMSEMKNWLLGPAQQTQNIWITLIHHRSKVFHVGPALYKCYTNALCLLGGLISVPLCAAALLHPDNITVCMSLPSLWSVLPCCLSCWSLALYVMPWRPSALLLEKSGL